MKKCKLDALIYKVVKNNQIIDDETKIRVYKDGRLVAVGHWYQDWILCYMTYLVAYEKDIERNVVEVSIL